MKGRTPDRAPVNRHVPMEDKELQCCSKSTRKLRPIVMCWRAFRPENVEDPAMESMRSAGNNDIQVQIEMPSRFRATRDRNGSWATYGGKNMPASIMCQVQVQTPEWQEDAMLCITPCREDVGKAA